MKYEVKDLNAPSRWNMRIWDDDKKEWLCQSDEECLTYYGFDITGGETTEFQGLPKWHPDRHLIWEQSTGLKDKNDKEIYEGDIIKFADLELAMKPTGVVCFAQGKFFVKDWDFGDGSYHIVDFYDYNIPCKDLEVIGNINENPELLEEGK